MVKPWLVVRGKNAHLPQNVIQPISTPHQSQQMKEVGIKNVIWLLPPVHEVIAVFNAFEIKTLNNNLQDSRGVWKLRCFRTTSEFKLPSTVA